MDTLTDIIVNHAESMKYFDLVFAYELLGEIDLESGYPISNIIRRSLKLGLVKRVMVFDPEIHSDDFNSTRTLAEATGYARTGMVAKSFNTMVFDAAGKYVIVCWPQKGKYILLSHINKRPS